jgi:energy-coupling factor transporter ATP-binding protein EcfA2
MWADRRSGGQRSRRYSSSLPAVGLPAQKIGALKDVSFEVKRGEILGIIGPNGAGKSTLLKILSRITEPTGGQARIRGRVGSLLEVGTGFHGELTGRENAYLNGAILGLKKSEIDRRFDEIISFAEVEKFVDTSTRRHIPYHADQLVSEDGTLDRYLRANQVCAFLVAIPSRMVSLRLSRVGQLSRHWDSSFVNKNLLAGANIDRELESLAAAGWSRIPVPPYYWLYELPKTEMSSSSDQSPKPQTEATATSSLSDNSTPGAEPIWEGYHQLAN